MLRGKSASRQLHKKWVKEESRFQNSYKLHANSAKKHSGLQCVKNVCITSAGPPVTGPLYTEQNYKDTSSSASLEMQPDNFLKLSEVPTHQ